MGSFIAMVWPVVRGVGILVFVVAIAMHFSKPDGGPEVGREAPVFTVSTLGETPFSLEARRGQVVVLDFWATWCPACRVGLPAIQALHRRYADDPRVYVATVNTDQGLGRISKVKAFMQRRGYDFPVLLEAADQGISLRYRVASIPTTVIIDGKGEIRWAESGIVSSVPERLTQHFDAAIKSVLADP